MSKINRYKFAKKCYKDYVILLLIKNKYILILIIN